MKGKEVAYMSKISERLESYQTQMSIYAEQHKVILASDVLDMIEQLQDDLKNSIDKVVEEVKKEYVDCQKNMNLVKDEDGNESGHIYDEYLNKSIAYETAINIVKQENNNGLE